MEKVLNLTHTDLDGTGCAVVCAMAFGKENVDWEAHHYETINERVMELIHSDEHKKYDRIILSDISINKEVSSAVDAFNKVHMDKLMLFDHHPNLDHLNQYDWATVIPIDKKTQIKPCGTSLVFDHLTHHMNLKDMDLDPIQSFVLLVRDYDTWAWTKNGNTKANDLNRIHYEYSREEFYDQMIDRISTYSKLIGYEDEKLLRRLDKKFESYLEEKEKQLKAKTHVGYNKAGDKFIWNYGIVFAENDISLLGNKLSERNQHLDFIMIINPGHGGISLRTIHDDVHLGKIARYMKGGGHQKAAGFGFDEEKIFNLVCNEFEMGVHLALHKL